MDYAELAREFLYPVRRLSVFLTVFGLSVLALITVMLIWMGFFVGILIAVPLAVIVAVFTVPVLLRYTLDVLRARARDLDPEPIGIESFSYYENLWSLFPALLAGAWVWAIWTAERAFGVAGAVAGIAAMAVLLPAMLLALALTRSPLESVNPLNQVRLLRRIWRGYWPVPAVFLAAVVTQLYVVQPPAWLAMYLNVYLALGLHAALGGVARSYSLFDEVGFATPAAGSVNVETARLEQRRGGVLTHAYGFASRGNVDGALKHISGWLERDEPYPGDAWPWFFDAMLRWDDVHPALRFAQRYLDVLLAAGEHRQAAKLMLRCRHVNPDFRPHAGSLDAALEAAREAGNPEIEAWLTRC